MTTSLQLCSDFRWSVSSPGAPGQAPLTHPISPARPIRPRFWRPEKWGPVFGSAARAFQFASARKSAQRFSVRAREDKKVWVCLARFAGRRPRLPPSSRLARSLAGRSCPALCALRLSVGLCALGSRQREQHEGRDGCARCALPRARVFAESPVCETTSLRGDFLDGLYGGWALWGWAMWRDIAVAKRPKRERESYRTGGESTPRPLPQPTPKPSGFCVHRIASVRDAVKDDSCFRQLQRSVSRCSGD